MIWAPTAASTAFRRLHHFLSAQAPLNWDALRPSLHYLQWRRGHAGHDSIANFTLLRILANAVGRRVAVDLWRGLSPR